MKSAYKNIWVIFCGRGIIAIPFFLLSFYLLACASKSGYVPGILLGDAAMLIGCIMIAYPIARLFAEPIGSLFYPDDEFKKAQPLYSIPESHIKQGLYEQAFQEYEAILQSHPQEIKAYTALLEIDLIYLKNPMRAEITYKNGLKKLKKEQRDILHTMHKAYLSRMHGQAANR